MKYLIALFILVFVGCQTAPYVRITQQDYPLAQLTKVSVSVIPGGMRVVSSNRREISSHFFLPNSDDKGEAEKAKRRYFIKVLILGEQRPYDVNVLAPIEEKIGGIYTVVDYDEGQALKYLKLIKEKLVQSREDRNVIDDFRAF